MSSYLSREEAAALVGAPRGLLVGVLKLAACGLKTDAILEYALAISEDREPPALPVPGGPKPVTIQLHSFLADPRQYKDTYRLDPELVNHLKSLELSDQEAARQEVQNAVAASPRIQLSGRPVRVVTSGSPGSTPNAAQPLANASAINSSLAAEIASNSTVYGSYPYTAYETSLNLARRFCVDLGRNFFVLSHSKKSAVALARITCVKGRDDPAVVASVVYVASDGKTLVGSDINSSYWNCKRGPRDQITPSTRKPGEPISPSSEEKPKTPQATGKERAGGDTSKK